ncbi:hypothetical protein EZ313_09785 [Ramlibacter henchirensis]|uniref:Glycosyltransferase n=1 Tax=Ramlibacter henchirensis TaxID=204072 RepID=A0A4Z0C565_9BURK|nr:GlcNAc-transferase family protein [Ramlibacter henchirensis]TFZ06887.1 hypothetical protein EZ313_09785 [Ramlibacter henchirensis]
MSVFVSIAAYCDPVLGFTLGRAHEKARRPQDLHFAIVDQSPQGPAVSSITAALTPARVSYQRIDPVFARGPCWARTLAMALYDGEDWYLQLDSHMDFEPGWDERLIDQARALAPGRKGVVLSAYPNAFAFENGRPVARPTTNKVLAHVVKPGVNFEADHLVLSFEAQPVETDEPVPGFHLGAGCLFAPGRFALEFPYDPAMYFHGEEQALAARLYTHGWDIFHMPGLPVYHLYNDGSAGVPARPLHWDAAHEAGRTQSWWELEQRSRARLGALLAGQPLGVYGLGRERTLAQYADWCGIDYANRTLGPQAYRPLVA